MHSTLNISRLAAAAVVVTMASLLVISCSSSKKSDSTSATPAPTAAPNGEADQATIDHFWATINALDPLATQTPGRDKATVLAQQVCTAITPSMTTKQAQDAVTAVLNAAAVRAAVIPTWAGASVAAFCPQYKQLISANP